MKFTVHITLDHVSGPKLDEDTLIDLFCGTIGKSNGAPKPLHLKRDDGDGTPSVYVVAEADDR